MSFQSPESLAREPSSRVPGWIWSVVIAQYVTPVLATIYLWVQFQKFGHPLGIDDDIIVSRVDSAVLVSCVSYMAMVVVAGLRTTIVNMLIYTVFLYAVGVVQDQWLHGLAAPLKSYSSDFAYWLDLWVRTLALTMLGLCIRGGGRLWRHVRSRGNQGIRDAQR